MVKTGPRRSSRAREKSPRGERSEHVAIGLALEDGEALRRAVEVLPRKQLNDEARNNQYRRGDQEGALESPGIGHKSAQQRPYGVANKEADCRTPG